MYDTKNHGNYKNEKNLRWHIELTQFDFDIVYGTTQINYAPDTLSRAYFVGIPKSTFSESHKSLPNPGITSLYRFARLNIIAMCP